MKIIFGVGSHLFIWESSIAKVVIKTTEDALDSFEQLPVDPHGTLSSHLEISPDAIGAYGKRRMGFGLQDTG